MTEAQEQHVALMARVEDSLRDVADRQRLSDLIMSARIDQARLGLYPPFAYSDRRPQLPLATHAPEGG